MTVARILFRGRGCRLPGAADVEEFTGLLHAGHCAVSEIPQSRWEHRKFLHPVPGTAGKAYSFAAGVLNDIYGFDPQVFGISPREAAQMDPQQRLLLQVVWEALEDAGIVPADLAGSHVGVYIGASGLDYGRRLGFDERVADAYMMTGNTLSLVSNRVSHAFDLRGPSMTVDTACSSSLVAMNEAVKAIRSGEIDMAIVGGTNLLLDPTPFVGFSAARMLSPTGLCQPFSANADGYVRAEGAAAFVLHRVEDGEYVPNYGSLVDIETNADGRTVNVALPSSDGQRVLLERLYDRAGVDPEALAFVEAHGTGTFVGDPVEAEALGRALGVRRTAPLPFGSVKSNIGHLEPASGAAGMLKALVAIEHGVLPASLHAETVNPNIPFDDLNLTLAAGPVPLPDRRAAPYAGVSSFGFGGTNVHAIIRAPEPAPAEPVAGRAAQEQQARRIFLTSAFGEAALKDLAGASAGHLYDAEGRRNDPFIDAMQRHRGSYPDRLAVSCAGPEAVQQALTDFRDDRKNPLVAVASADVSDAPAMFVFSGNGSQFAGMSLAAFASNPDYQAAYRRVDEKFEALSGRSLVGMLTADDLAEDLTRVEVAQPLLFADQVATTEALRARGLHPAAALGHSGGEVAAAWCAGALDLDQAVRLIHDRSLSQVPLAGRGTMAALQVSEDEARAGIAEFADPDIGIAAVNSPRSVSLVGPIASVEAFIAWAKTEKRWAAVRLRVNYPYHSAAQDEIEAELRDGLSLAPGETTIPFLSSVTGRIMAGSELDADYWWSNVRQPVMFHRAVLAAWEQGNRAFVEIGPQPVLAAYLKASLSDHVHDCAILHSTAKSDRQEDDPIEMACLRAAAHGVRVQEDVAQGPAWAALRELPHYPWQNREYRSDETVKITRGLGISGDFHPFLGIQAELGARTWGIDIDPDLAPELADHVIGETAVVPGSVFLETALAAAQRSLRRDRVELRDADIVAPLPLIPGAIQELRSQVNERFGGVIISSRAKFDDADWRDHAAARIGAVAEPETDMQAPPAPARERLEGDRPGELLYDFARLVGINYGPAFRRVSHFRETGDGAIEVILTPSPYERPDMAQLVLDPIAVDAVFHGLIAGLAQSGAAQDRIGYVPVHAASVKALRPGAAIRSGRVRIERIGAQSVLADFTCYGEDGAVVGTLTGVRFRAARLFRPVDFAAHAYVTDLHPIAAIGPDPAPAGAGNPDATAAQILRAAEADDAAPGDDSFLLIEAVAQRIAYDLMQGLAGRDRRVRLPDGMDPARLTYLNNLLNRLSGIGLAAFEDEEWVLADQCELPEAGSLLTGLMAERPDLGAECGVLATLKTRLGARLLEADGTGGAEAETAGEPEGNWSGEAFFGRAALENLRTGSAYHARRAGVLAQSLPTLLRHLPLNRQVKVAEITAGPTPVLRMLDRAAPHPSLALFRIAPAGDGVDQGMAAADLEIATPVAALTATPEELAAQGPFDLIVSQGSLHHFADDPAVLTHLRTALAQGGALIALEDAPSALRDMVGGMDAAWFARSLTPDYPVGQERLAEEYEALLESDWTGEYAVCPMPDGLAGATLIVARNAAEPPETISAEPQPVHGNGEDAGFWEALAAALPENAALGAVARDAATGIADATLSATGGEGGEDRHVTLLHIPEGDGATDAQAQLSARLLHLSSLLEKAAQAPGPVWVFLPGGAGYPGVTGQKPLQAAIWAFLRTAKNEYPGLDIRCLDVAGGAGEGDAARHLARMLDRPGRETEIVVSPDHVAAIRVHQGLPQVSAPDGDAGSAGRKASLTSAPAGTLDELSWKSSARRAPAPGEVEVAVEATGLNYRDVMWALGLLPEEALEKGFAGPTLGIECAGRVARVGAGVTGLKPGDPVVTFGPSCFSSHLVMHQDWVGKMPDGIEPAAAATIPVAFFTAYYALVDLARLGKGETVLIHGGAGGVGLAAIQIAQWLGARVIATAGGPVKQEFLKALGVEHVFSSRALSFAEDVARVTEGRGVDVVLNSLAGAAMERSLAALAPFGRFLELGKQDFYANTGIGLRPLKENIAYFGIDVDQLLSARPEHARDLFARMIEKFRDGSFAPLPYRLFAGDQVGEGFRLMQRSGHIGKIVVAPTAPGAAMPPVAAPVFAASPEGWHVVFGGLGGLGLEVMEWLARSGARRIVLSGRTGIPTPGAQARIDRLSDFGCAVRIAACDLSDTEAVAALFAELRAEAPVSGVIHSAMVLEDMPIAQLDQAVLDRALPAKVAGIGNLDAATRGDALDYFVAFSSIAAMIGNHGQGAYVAANAYLETVMRARRDAGLPGLAIGWGAITDAGYLTREADKAALIRRITGNAAFTAGQALHALERLLARNAAGAGLPPVVAVSPMGWSGTVAALAVLKGPTFAKLEALGRYAGDGGDFDDLRAALLELSPEKAEKKLIGFLTQEIARILRVPENALSPTRPVSDYGMDSLMGVELGLAAQRSLGDDIPMMAVSDALSITDISRKIVAHLHGGGSAAPSLSGDLGNLAAQHVRTEDLERALDQAHGKGAPDAADAPDATDPAQTVSAGE